jgi:hypothetical protein
VRSSGIEAAEAETLSEIELEWRVFGAAPTVKPGALAAPDCAWIRGELKRHRHVALQLLWEEYAGRYGAAAYPKERVLPVLPPLAEAPEALDASATPRRREPLCRLRRTHRADLRTQRQGGVPAHLFVSSMGASGCAYAEATCSESRARVAPDSETQFRGCLLPLNNGPHHFHALSARSKLNVEPRPGCDSTEILPPCRSTIFLQMASPTPVPANSSRLCSR